MPSAFSVFTLGCRLNQADSALMADRLRSRGLRLVPWGESADILVVNSCAVTAAASRKSRQAVRAARRRCPRARIVLVGCSADVEPVCWQNESSVDLIVPNASKKILADLLLEGNSGKDRLGVSLESKPCSGTFAESGCGYYSGRTRANLKIQEGCDFGCSYCIVPRARGPARSRAWSDVMREAEELLSRGHRELVLTGVNIATYEDRGRNLARLMAELLEIQDDFRLRLSSTEPGPVLGEVLEVMKNNPSVCRFLHLPMQYGEDTVLKAMNRRCSVKEYVQIAEAAVDAVPGLCLGTDVIVGFPGETDATFRACVELVRTVPFSLLHAFPFSLRKGTPAEKLPGRVHGGTVSERSRILRSIARKKVRKFAQLNVNRVLQVLTEEQNESGAWEGWSDNYLRVVLEQPENSRQLEENIFVPARITEFLGGRCVKGVPATGLPRCR